jgi:EcoRII C terminal
MQSKENFNIKKEMQGTLGLIKKIRQLHLPDTTSMARLAQKVFEEKNDRCDDVDFSLDKLLLIEYDIFLEKQIAIVDNFIEYADNAVTQNQYPTLRNIIDKYKMESLGNSNSTSILKGITNIIIALADSNRQSRVSRSGSSLMHHISYLLERHGFINKVDFQREFVLKEGCKLDFFFPDGFVYNNEPKNCCAVACQTTSNDRFRLTFAQMPKDTRNRACTAIGCKNFGDKLGPESLTNNKLQEAKKEGVKFVILEQGINTRLRQSNSVMSYNQWFSELNSLKPFWYSN